MTECVFPIWHTTHMQEKVVGDFVRAVCSDKLHVRFGGEGLVFLGNQDLASYPTSERGRATYMGKGGSVDCILVPQDEGTSRETAHGNLSTDSRQTGVHSQALRQTPSVRIALC
jgi:hypothetical protein